jgi:DNA-binding NarL/FixJ family response regulator
MIPSPCRVIVDVDKQSYFYATMTVQTVSPLKQQLNVAIIEDDLVIRRNVERYLSLEDKIGKTLSFGSVESFLGSHEVQQATYDLLLLDIGLPGMSGLEALSVIKEQYPELDIIMLTAFEDEATVVKALCSGAVAYVSKKSSLEEMVQAIFIVSQGGSYMSPVIAREILNYMVRGELQTSPSLLTARQTEILECLVEGKSYSRIAKELNVSIETIRTHIKRMYKTIHVNNKVEAVAKYLRGEI